MFASNIGSSKQLEASNVVRNYPPNASVTIYYDADAPAVSVVERKVMDYYKRAVNKEAIKLMFSILVFALVAYYLIAV